MILPTDFVALVCLVVAVLILQKGVQPKTLRFRQFLRGLWAVTALLWVVALLLWVNQ